MARRNILSKDSKQGRAGQGKAWLGGARLGLEEHFLNTTYQDHLFRKEMRESVLELTKKVLELDRLNLPHMADVVEKLVARVAELEREVKAINLWGAGKA